MDASSDKRGRGGEDKQAKEDGGQGTHADKPDNRQESLESSRCYFLSSSVLSVSILDKTGRKKTTQSWKNDKHDCYEKVK